MGGPDLSLAALIAAYHEAEDPGGVLRATLPLAGRTLIERQASLAAWAGAERVVVVVERVPAELLAAVDRLRARGLDIVLARDADEAADAVEAGQRLLVFGDGVLVSDIHIARLLAVGGASLLTIPDVRVDDRYERIDATSRWAGLALFDGEMLKRTAAMLGEWDLQSTLLRRGIQAGARQLSVRGEPADELLVAAEGSADLDRLRRRIFEGAGARREDWVSRYLLGPVEQMATRQLMESSATPTALSLTGTLLTALAALAFGWDWLGLGLVFLLLATPLDGIAERLGALRMQELERGGWWAEVTPVLAAAALVALGFALSDTRGWGCVALAATTIAFMLALRTEAQGREVPGRLWLAERKGMAWLLLPFAATGLWATGMAALACYAAGSFFWVQRFVHRRPSAPQAD
jgi:hypothetical protein